MQCVIQIVILFIPQSFLKYGDGSKVRFENFANLNKNPYSSTQEHEALPMCVNIRQFLSIIVYGTDHICITDLVRC